MDQLLPYLAALLGGAGLTYALEWLRHYRQDGVGLSVSKDDQTVRWRDNALLLSAQVLAADARANHAEQELHRCMMAREDCTCKTGSEALG